MLNQEPFKLHSIIRQKFVGYLEHLTPEQLADIPYGFNNNIWWNIVHVVATQQLLSYYLSDILMIVYAMTCQITKKELRQMVIFRYQKKLLKSRTY